MNFSFEGIIDQKSSLERLVGSRQTHSRCSVNALFVFQIPIWYKENIHLVLSGSVMAAPFHFLLTLLKVLLMCWFTKICIYRMSSWSFWCENKNFIVVIFSFFPQKSSEPASQFQFPGADSEGRADAPSGCFWHYQLRVLCLLWEEMPSSDSESCRSVRRSELLRSAAVRFPAFLNLCTWNLSPCQSATTGTSDQSTRKKTALIKDFSGHLEPRGLSLNH